MPVKIYDLSVGGCFINSIHDSPAPGQTFKITLDLPGVRGIAIRAETVYSRPGFGYAVRFLELTDEMTARLARALERSRKDRED